MFASIILFPTAAASAATKAQDAPVTGDYAGAIQSDRVLKKLGVEQFNMLLGVTDADWAEVARKRAEEAAGRVAAAQQAAAALAAQRAAAAVTAKKSATKKKS